MRSVRKVGATIAFSIVVVLALAGVNTAALYLVSSQYAIDDTFRFMSMTPYSPDSSIGERSDPQLRFAADTIRAQHPGASGLPISVD